LERYVKHNLESHDNDIWAWDYYHGILHDQLKHAAKPRWDDEEDRALEVLTDQLSACPICHKVPLWSKKWYCDDCQHHITLKDVAHALNDYRKKYGKDMTIAEFLNWGGR
jgi:hypothetical protein